MRTIFVLCCFAVTAFASPLKMITSTTDLAWAAQQIGGTHVEVKPLLRGSENPHFVDAVPEFIRLTSEASVACVIGLDLELGWMPKVLSRSMNAQVQPGGKGYCDTGKNVPVLERPTGPVNRSMGDVHPSGNPHFWLSPKHFAAAARVITDTLEAVDPVHYTEFEKNFGELSKKLDAIQASNKKRIDVAIAGKNPVLLEYHKEFAYFLQAYGLRSIGSVEEKPGVPPSAGRLAEIAQTAKSAGVSAVLAADTAPKKTLDRLKELSGVDAVIVPMSLRPATGLDDYEKHQTLIIDALMKSISPVRG